MFVSVIIMGVLDNLIGFWLSLLLFGQILIERCIMVDAFPSRMDWLARDTSEIDSEIVYPKLHHLNRGRRSLNTPYSDTVMTLQTNGTLLYIQLYPSTSILNPDIIASIKHDNGTTESFHPLAFSYEEPCLFKGYIINDKGGQVALSTCESQGEMYGTIYTPDGVFSLGPVSEYVPGSHDSDSNNIISPHVLIRHIDDISFCGLCSNEADLKFLNEEEMIDMENRVPREAVERKIVELGVFVDKELYNTYLKKYPTRAKNKLMQAVLAIINEVELVYNYDSLKEKLKIVIAKLEILSGAGPNTAGGDIDKYLDNFCIWQERNNPSDSAEGHWDYAILLTGLDVYKEANTKVIGLAWVNGMCRENYSCSISEGNTFEAGFVIAHEMGHSLGAQHDGYGNSCDKDAFLMSAKTGAGKVSWSSCSNSYIQKFFREGMGNCLSDNSSPPSVDLVHAASGLLPGEQYSLTEQCQLAIGPEHTAYQTSEDPFNNVCKELWCRELEWARASHPALDGSSCDNGKWCREGKCVPKVDQTTNSDNNNINKKNVNGQQYNDRNRSNQSRLQDFLSEALDFVMDFFG
ncbi:A disintegrin and metalloproteinase with thrombospondin motifs adt-1-like [Tachypleus tridentatus]|uniref:A disintegrin and metalloproteinase with thrombospondin motifs adt-1-like n=1 Tax=Tachypleus tridentatus TaxID=6853 RepID=UPI003FD28CAD